MTEPTTGTATDKTKDKKPATDTIAEADLNKVTGGMIDQNLGGYNYNYKGKLKINEPIERKEF